MTYYNEAEAVPARVRSARSDHPSRFGDRIFSNLTLVFALVIVGILLGLIIVLSIDAMPASAVRAFLSRQLVWDPVQGSIRGPAGNLRHTA